MNGINSVSFDKLAQAYPSKPTAAGTSALKGAMEMQEIIQNDLTEMMRDITPHLGQNVNMEA